MAHLDYTCCACCDSKIDYAPEAVSKTELCSSCINNIKLRTGKEITSTDQFQNLINSYNNKDELYELLKTIGFNYCFYTNSIDRAVDARVGWEYSNLIKNMYNSPKPLKVLILKAENKYYISDDIEGRYLRQVPSRCTNLGSMYIDGSIPDLGLAGGWYVVNSTPRSIKKLIPEYKTNFTWTIKDGLQHIVDEEYPDIDYTFNGEYFPKEYLSVKFAYSLTFDTIEEHYEDVLFELITLESFDNYVPKYISLNVLYDVKDIITTPKVFLPTKPCIVSGVELYKLIRDHIKRNINPKVAKITSDYDFCLCVEKIIDIEPYTVKYDISKTKRPKYVDKLITNTKLVVYKNAPKVYQDYPVQEDWYADSAIEMEQRVTKFLDDLITKINTPVSQCPTCKGYGVIDQPITE